MEYWQPAVLWQNSRKKHKPADLAG